MVRWTVEQEMNREAAKATAVPHQKSVHNRAWFIKNSFGVRDWRERKAKRFPQNKKKLREQNGGGDV